MSTKKFTFAPETTPLAGYTIKRGIQRGGFGEVYYAHSDGGKEVALKLLHSHAEVELRGTELCLNLKHPNLISIHDIKRDDDGDVWIVMEYVSGATLDGVLTEEFPDGMPTTEVRNWLAGLAAGVDYLHDRGIVHRDLKPQNLHREAGQVKIGDVGLSKIITPSQRGAQTESIGTIYYMAPEISRGEYGPEIDVYSSAAIVYELLTGHVPFDGETTAEILNRHLTDQPDLQPLPPALRPVLAHALAKDPAERTANLGTLLSEFDAALAGKPPVSPPPPPEVVADPPNPNDSLVPPAAGPPATADAVQHIVKDLGFSEEESLACRAVYEEHFGVTSAGTGGATVAATDSLTSHTRPGRPPQPTSYDVNPLGPLSPRSIPLSRRGLETTAAMTAAILFSGLLAGGGWWIGMFDEGTRATPLAAVAYGLTTLVASWAVLIGTKAWEGTGTESLHLRRLSLLLLGGGVGAAGWWLHRVLLIDLPPLTETQNSGLVDSVGAFELVHNSQPTLTGYVIFFSLLFGTRRWWWHTDSFRPKRLRVASLLLTLTVSGLLGLVLRFPLQPAIAWGVGIAVVVQLAAPWVAPEQRASRIAVDNPPSPETVDSPLNPQGATDG